MMDIDNVSNTNTNTNSDYDDEDEDDDYEDIVYEPEEPCANRYCIALCELYNDRIHGPGPLGHYLVNCRYKQLRMDWIEETADFMNAGYLGLASYHHDLFPNYKEIVISENYIKPEIVECIDKDGYCLAIIKTIWIKIIQRIWRKVLEKRKYKQSVFSLRYREINGKWPANCYR